MAQPNSDCGKTRYDTAHEAWKAARSIARRAGGRRDVYPCPDCRAYHLTTHRPKRRGGAR